MTNFIEQDCTFKGYTAGGAIVNADTLIGYIGKITVFTTRDLTDWHGNKIGTVKLTSGWSTGRFKFDRMHQAYAIVDGKTYTGRTRGEGMLFRGKRCKSKVTASKLPIQQPIGWTHIDTSVSEGESL